MRTAKSWAASMALVSLCTVAQAQTYPVKPIRTVMTIGGGIEAAVRALSTRMSEALGQPVILDVQSGAGGAVGADIVARSAPDGYTIVFGSTGAFLIRPFLTKNTPYNTLKDFTPITRLGDGVAVVLANNALPVKTMRELVDYARANPGKISYGTSGIGSTQHLSGEMLQQAAGIKLVHVPYKTGAQSFQDLLGGQVQVVFGVFSSSISFVEAGKVKLLAIDGRSRYSKMPDVPTVVESVPGYDYPPGFMGYLGPAGLPAAITRRLHAEGVKAIFAPEVRGVFEKLGLVVDSSPSPEEFAAEVRRHYEQAGRMIKIAGIAPE